MQIAADIEARGHFQGISTLSENHDAVCVVTSHAFPDPYTYNSSLVEYKELLKVLSARIGFTLHVNSSGNLSSMGIWDWNDSTPTAEVLEVLRSL